MTGESCGNESIFIWQGSRVIMRALVYYITKESCDNESICIWQGSRV